MFTVCTFNLFSNMAYSKVPSCNRTIGVKALHIERHTWPHNSPWSSMALSTIPRMVGKAMSFAQTAPKLVDKTTHFHCNHASKEAN